VIRDWHLPGRHAKVEGTLPAEKPNVGWLDFLIRPPSRDKFAKLVMDELRKCGGQCGGDGALNYDREQFVIERGNQGFINLANLYQEYCQAARKERPKVLHRFIRGCLGTSGFELPEEFCDVHPDLLPVVRSRFYLESVGLQSRVHGGEGVAVPQQTIGDHLSLSLVYDLPQAMRSIIQDDLDKWQVSFYEAVEAARQNLQQIDQVSFACLQGDRGEGVYLSTTGDNYDASRLALLDLVRKMPVRGDHVAMVPNRDTLVITGSEDEAGLTIMCKVADDSFSKPRPISTVALRLVGDEWESWLPDFGMPCYARLRDLRMRTLGMEYNDQKELLDQIYEQTGENVFVASFSAIQHKETRQIRSYSVWSEGIDTLLPETDDVLLLRGEAAADKINVVAAGSFERVRDVAGDLMQPLGTYPERYRVERFPTERQLAAIGKREWAAL
jgi:hypothetical protein